MPNNIVKNPNEEKKWDKSKSIVSREYPNIKEGSDEYYKLVVGTFKKMTKAASGEEIINLLAEEKILSKNAVDKYREENQYINIVSKLFTPQEEKVADNDTLKMLLGGAALAVGTAGAGYGMAAGTKGIQKYLARKKRPERMKDIIKFAPIVKEMDPALVNEGMRTLENYNPEMAKHPLIAGSFLKSIHNYGGVTPEQANILKGDTYGKDLTKTIGEGIGTASRLNKPGLGDFTKAYDIADKNKDDKLKNRFYKKITEASADEVKEADFKEKAKTMAGAALIAGGTVAGLAGAGKAGSMIYNKLSRNGRLEAVKQFSPELKKADPKLLNAGMKTLERLSPQVSKDPLAAGGFLKQIIKGKGIKPAMTKDLVDTSNRENQENPFLTAGKILGKDLP